MFLHIRRISISRSASGDYIADNQAGLAEAYFVGEVGERSKRELRRSKIILQNALKLAEAAGEYVKCSISLLQARRTFDEMLCSKNNDISASA